MRRISMIIGLSAVLVGAAACGPGATPSPTAPAATQALPSEAPPTETAAATSAAAVTVEAEVVGDAGTILVDAASGLTVYIFTDDVMDSGTSACIDGCITAWPALTVPAGGTPTGGPGVTGTLGTITRADDGSLQVTYNGLPLYFFANDDAPGDLNGVYDKWETVAP